MKSTLLNSLKIFILFFIPVLNFAQAPDLGLASSFALFSGAGAFDNIGASYITGDIGTNAGAFTGFPPGTVVGQIHVADGVSAQTGTDVDEAYSYLSGLTCGLVLGTGLGNGQVLTPNIYCLGAASTLNGDLVLDGQGDPNALFIFKIDGALSTGTFSNIILINSATLCNVFWQINGQFTLGDSSVFRGTIVGNGAITLLEASVLEGRGLTRAGKIALHNNKVDVAGDCAIACSLEVKLSAIKTNCHNGADGKIKATVTGGTGDYSYLWSNGSTASIAEGLAKGTYTVTVTDNITGCTATSQANVRSPAKLKAAISVTAITNNETCDGTANITASGGTPPYTYLWNDGYTGSVRSGLCMGTYTVIVTDAKGCQVMEKVKILCIYDNIARSSLSEQNSASVIKVAVSPNPSKGIVNISIIALKDQAGSVTLTDLAGKQIFINKINLAAGNNIKSYNWGSLVRGVYFVHIRTNEKDEVLKIVLN